MMLGRSKSGRKYLDSPPHLSSVETEEYKHNSLGARGGPKLRGLRLTSPPTAKGRGVIKEYHLCFQASFRDGDHTKEGIDIGSTKKKTEAI